MVKADGTTNDHHIRVTGIAAPGSYVQLLDAAGAVVGGATATNPGGTYTITTPTVLVGSFTYRTRVESVAGNIGPASPPMTVQVLSTPGDYFGNGYADLITYDAFDQVWSILSPATGATTQVSFGLPNAVPVPADYGGDGKTDLAVFQPSTGVWLIRNSADGTLSRYTFGGPGDIPVPADYTGVGHAEVAVYRPSTAQWFVSNQATGAGHIWTFGFPGQSIPVPADYDGQSGTDLGVYVPATGSWSMMNTTSGAVSHTVFGGVGFKPVPADYDGVGRADIAVYCAGHLAVAHHLGQRRAPSGISPTAPPSSTFRSRATTTATARPTWPCTGRSARRSGSTCRSQARSRRGRWAGPSSTSRAWCRGPTS